MLSYTLADYKPELKYEPYKVKENTTNIFIGSVIKNLYDEKRISIKSEHSPKRFLYANGDKLMHLYGVFLEPEEMEYRAAKTLSNIKEDLNTFNYSSYTSKMGIQTDQSYLYYTPGFYPLNFTYISKYMDNYSVEKFYKYDKKIPKFQQLTQPIISIVST